MRARGFRRRWLLFLAAAILIAPLAPDDSLAKGSITRLQDEFRAAIDRVSGAAVVCLAADVPAAQAGMGSSGVIVTKTGYVLSDGDVGAYAKRDGNRASTAYKDEVEVRLPDLEEGGYRAYAATVVRRLRPEDTTLLKIQDPPLGGFGNFIAPATGAHLQIGDYLFVTGNAFGAASETPPATTAGVVSALTSLPKDDAGGAWQHIYTSAAVNPGVNGGPAVDVEGRLIGTVSTFMTPAPGQPFQFLGKIVPIDRIRAAFSDLEDADEVFAQTVKPKKAKEAAALQTVFRHAARRAYPAVVSLTVQRSTPLSTKFPVARNRAVDVPRYLGPFSGVLVEEEGWIVTSLRNLTNVSSLVYGGWPAPADAQMGTGLRAIEKITAHLPDGREAEAKVTAHDGRLGLVLLKADLHAGASTRPAGATLEPAPPEAFAQGRFVVSVGNPFGKDRQGDPLVAVGVLSKFHATTTPNVWRGQWQTDAAATDANSGGALVDMRGRFVGMLQVWTAPRHGRNSGIGFVVPWERIEAALPRLKEGKSVLPAFLGVQWKQGPKTATIGQVVPDSPAAEAGLRPGDTIVAVDDRETPTLQAVMAEFGTRWSGESIRLGIDRGGERIDIEVVLGARPGTE